MKKTYCLLILLIVFIINLDVVKATSGLLDDRTIKVCDETLYGRHGSDNHWHLAINNEDGTYSSIGRIIYLDPCPIEEKIEDNNIIDSDNSKYEVRKPKEIEIPKSSDNSLSSVSINDKNIKIKDEMEFSTYDSEARINIITNDSKAVINYDGKIKLDFGNNELDISVTAENGDNRVYKLNINRKKILSNNVDIKEIYVNGDMLTFNNYSSNQVIILYIDNKVKIDYKLENGKARAKIVNNNRLKVGKNRIILELTAQNGDTKDYIINVVRTNIVVTFLSILIETLFLITPLLIIILITYIFLRRNNNIINK